MDQRLFKDLLKHATFGYAVYYLKPSIKLLTSNHLFDNIIIQYNQQFISNQNTKHSSPFLEFLSMHIEKKQEETHIYLQQGSYKVSFAYDEDYLYLYLYDQLESSIQFDLLTPDQLKYQNFSFHNLSYIWEVNPDGLFTYVDPIVSDVLGYHPNEIIGKKHFYDLFHEEDKETVKKMAFETFAKHETFGNVLNRNISKTNQVKWLLSSGVPKLDEKGNLIGYRGIDTDMTQWILSSEKAEELEDRFLTVFKHSPLSMLQYNEYGEIILYNQKFLKMIDEKNQDISKMNVFDFLDNRLKMTFELSQDGTANRVRGSIINPFKKVKIPVSADFMPLYNNDKEISGGLVVIEDLSLAIEKEKRMEKLLKTDSLTQVYNRSHFDFTIDNIRKSDLPLGFIICDINGLRIINNSFGFDQGDQIISYVASRIKKVVGNKGIVCRVGGDEFGMIFKKSNLGALESMTADLKKQFTLLNPFGYEIKVSFGYALYDSLDVSFTKTFTEAEKMMFTQKVYDGSSMTQNTIDVMMATLFEKSPREMNHSKRVSSMSWHIAKKLNISSSFEEKVRISGLLHDIGKINIDDSILNKKSELSEEEWVIMKKHPETGYQILSAVSNYDDIAKIVLFHHERYDGMGYPNGLYRDEIPIESRIIAVADAFDAMTKDRTYRQSLSVEEAIETLIREKGNQFDPKIVDIFLKQVLQTKLSSL
ncbi:MAG: diguanylate cyclase [Tenericutes bacterium]|nr:diguanylate cyclase [Mycoplasmatota bacterium]